MEIASDRVIHVVFFGIGRLPTSQVIMHIMYHIMYIGFLQILIDSQFIVRVFVLAGILNVTHVEFVIYVTWLPNSILHRLHALQMIFLVISIVVRSNGVVDDTFPILTGFQHVLGAIWIVE